MNFMESVRHFTFLLSKKNLEFVNGRKSRTAKAIARKIEDFSQPIQQALATHYAQEHEDQTTTIPNEMRNSVDLESPSHVRHSSTRTVDVSTAMFRESNRERESPHKNSVSQMRPITKKDQERVITKAIRCLEWAHDPARPVVPGAEAMTNDQVRLLNVTAVVSVMQTIAGLCVIEYFACLSPRIFTPHICFEPFSRLQLLCCTRRYV